MGIDDPAHATTWRSSASTRADSLSARETGPTGLRDEPWPREFHIARAWGTAPERDPRETGMRVGEGTSNGTSTPCEVPIPCLRGDLPPSWGGHAMPSGTPHEASRSLGDASLGSDVVPEVDRPCRERAGIRPPGARMPSCTSIREERWLSALAGL